MQYTPNHKSQSETKPKRLMSFFPTPIIPNLLMKTTQLSAYNLKTHIEFIVAQKFDKHNVEFQMDINKSSLEYNSLSVFKNTTLLRSSHPSKYSFPINTTQDDPIWWAETLHSGTTVCHLNYFEIPRDFHPFFDSWSPTSIPTPKTYNKTFMHSGKFITFAICSTQHKNIAASQTKTT